MNSDIGIRQFFRMYAAAADIEDKGIVTRAINGLVRGKIITMNQLCGVPSKKLINVRNVGEKSIELILRVQEQYLKISNFDPMAIKVKEIIFLCNTYKLYAECSGGRFVGFRTV